MSSDSKSDRFNLPQWSSDRFFNGRLQVYQEKEGYRFSLDAAIAAAGVRPKKGDVILDLGTGCGIIALMLAFRFSLVRIIGIEIQDQLVDLARTNIRENQLDPQIAIVPGDARKMHVRDVGGPVDWIVCNPPYRRASSGRINPKTQKALARHEINITMTDIVQCAQKFLRHGGQFVTIYPAERGVDLLANMREAGIEPKWMQCIHSHVGDQAKLLCVRGKKGGRPGLSIQTPLIIYDEHGAYTDEVERMLQP